jgi:hypothetical protein
MVIELSLAGVTGDPRRVEHDKGRFREHHLGKICFVRRNTAYVRSKSRGNSFSRCRL